MPDFFDRLVARDAHRGGAGSSAAARAADLTRRAGVIRVTPRVPTPFEWPTAAGLEEVVETGAAPGWPAHAVEPTRPLASAPPSAAAAERLGYAQTGQAPVARRGGDRDLRPPPQLLLVPPTLPAPALGPAAADAPEAFPAPQPHRPAPVAHAARDRDAGPTAAAPGPAAAPASHPLPYRPAAPAAAAARDSTAPAGRVRRLAAARPPERVVQVRIGRIEVRPTEQAQRRRAADRAPGRPAPQLSLDRFLAGGGGGR
jgi:hypothetical protein